MIRRVSGTRRSASKVANPRRRRRRTAMIKRSNPVRKRRKTTAKRRKTTAKRRNPSHKRHTSVAHRRNPARRRTRRRNPSVAGINLEKDLLPIAVGSGLAIAVKAAISAMPFVQTTARSAEAVPVSASDLWWCPRCAIENDKCDDNQSSINNIKTPKTAQRKLRPFILSSYCFR